MFSRSFSPKIKRRFKRCNNIDLDTYINNDYAPITSSTKNRVISPYVSRSSDYSPSDSFIISTDYAPVNANESRYAPSDIRLDSFSYKPSRTSYYDPLTSYFYSYFYNPQQYSSERVTYSPTYEHGFRYHPRVFVNDVDKNIDLVIAQTPIIYRLIKDLLR